jgi:hypothetical protein
LILLKVISELNQKKNKNMDIEETLLRIEQVLKNHILEIADEYKGRKYEDGVSVFNANPVKIFEELRKALTE